MPLDQLADQISLIHQRGRSTPVLVSPRYVSLRTELLVALAAEVTRRIDLPVRYQWHRGMPGPFSFLSRYLSARSVGRANQQLLSQLGPIGCDATLEVTAIVGQPTTSSGSILIGISGDRQELPAWTIPIHFTASPIEHNGLESRHAA